MLATNLRVRAISLVATAALAVAACGPAAAPSPSAPSVTSNPGTSAPASTGALAEAGAPVEAGALVPGFDVTLGALGLGAAAGPHAATASAAVATRLMARTLRFVASICASSNECPGKVPGRSQCDITRSHRAAVQVPACCRAAPAAGASSVNR